MTNTKFKENYWTLKKGKKNKSFGHMIEMSRGEQMDFRPGWIYGLKIISSGLGLSDFLHQVATRAFLPCGVSKNFSA